MKLLTRLGGLGRSGGGLISLINRQFHQSRRPSSSIHLVSCRRHMVTREPSGPAPAANHDRRWTILDHWSCPSDFTAVNVVPDGKTVAESRTSLGRPFRVSLSPAAPPAISFICIDRAGHEPTSTRDGFHCNVIAAHDDSVLISGPGSDYFVYKAAAGQPPSLSLLPTCRHPMYERDNWGEPPGDFIRTGRWLKQMDTGLLRCGGEDDDGRDRVRDVLVAQLQIAPEAPFDTAELCVLRPGDRDWEFKEAVPIVHHNNNNDGGRPGRRHDLGRWQELNVAVPAGNRFLCWVNYDLSTFLVCDMAEVDNPKLRYVPLPVKAVPPKEEDDDDDDEHEEQLPWHYCRTIGAAPSGGAAPTVRFVSIDNRCCCGTPVIRSLCERSSSAFMVTTWTMALTTTGEPLEWVKEGVLDCEELWALLAGHDEGIPRVFVSGPVVSPANPDVVCFMADGMHSQTIWTLEVDMRRKTLISVVPCPRHPQGCVNYGNHLPAKLGC